MIVLAAFFIGIAIGFAFGIAYAIREHQREDADRVRRLERAYRSRG